MSLLLNLVPYVLAGLTILLGIFQLIKEWDEYDKLRFPWLRRAALAVLILIAALTFVSLHLDNKSKDEEARKSEGDIRELKTKVQAANDAQTNNTALFLKSFDAMSKEVSNLKTEVKTEALQKKLTSVEAELEKTQKAMAPGPKAELTFTFVPFVSPPLGQPIVPVTDVTLPLKLDGSVHIEWTVINLTAVDAANADLNIQICDACKYAKEPDGLTKLPGMRDTIRFLSLPHQQAMEAYKTVTVDVIPPPLVREFTVALGYRCTTCILPKAPSEGTVHILGR